MHVYVCIYTCMSVNSCCQHVQLLYCPKNDRHSRETRKNYVFNVQSSTGFGQSRGQIMPVVQVFMRTGSCLLVSSIYASEHSPKHCCCHACFVEWCWCHHLEQEAIFPACVTVEHQKQQVLGTKGTGACFQPEQCFSTTIWFLLDSN